MAEMMVRDHCPVRGCLAAAGDEASHARMFRFLEETTGPMAADEMAGRHESFFAPCDDCGCEYGEGHDPDVEH